MAARRPFVVLPTLTAIAIAFRNPGISYVADDVLPRMPVFSERFSWTKYPIEEGFRSVDNRVGRTGRVNRIGTTSSQETSAVEDFGLDAPVPISDIEEAEKMRSAGLGNDDPEADAIQAIQDYNLIQREIRVARLVQNPAAYPAQLKLALSGTDQFSDFENSDPIEVIKAALRAPLVFRPNQVTMGFNTWDRIRSHPKLISAVKGGLSKDGMITREQFAALFELKKVIVGEAFADASAYGQAADIQRIWGNDMVFQYINPAPARGSAITHGFTATYGRPIAGRYEDENVGLQGGTVVRAGERMKELIVAPGCGFLLQDVVAEQN